MSEVDQHSNTKKLNPNETVRLTVDYMETEFTQRIDFDSIEIDNEDAKEALVLEINKDREKSVTSFVGRTFFSRKLLTDDFVKSSTVISAIPSAPLPEEQLTLQNIKTNYELKYQFSEGTQGIIRAAFDKSLKRNVVIKSLKVGEDEEAEQQNESLFISEARIMAQLDHPSIIPLYGLHSGVENKLHLAMKHIHGKTLEHYLNDVIALYKGGGIKKFDEKHSIFMRIEYLIKICAAVDYAHCKGVVHKDLKPGNVMIGNFGGVYVMDWGLACLINPNKKPKDKHVAKMGEHHKNVLAGTPRYIAPELLRGEACSPQSDVFALGIMFFEIITLRKAVNGDNINDVFSNIINEKYNPFKHRFLKGNLPAELKAIFDKATHTSLSRRYQSAKDMLEDLKHYLLREETTARPDNIARKAMRVMSNYKTFTFSMIFLLLTCLFAITIYSLTSQNVLIKEQGARESMLMHFQEDASNSAQKINQFFNYFNNQREHIVYYAGHILNDKLNRKFKLYSLKDYQSAPFPPGYAYSPAYDAKISLDNAVYKFGSGANKISRGIIALQAVFKHTMFTSSSVFKDKPKGFIKKLIMKRGAPLIWIAFGLKNGALLAYPGTDLFSESYDPRERPWYQKALLKKGSYRWTEPYRCAVTSKMLMSINSKIYDEKKNFQGVISLCISLDYLKSQFQNYWLPFIKISFFMRQNDFDTPDAAFS